MATAHTTNAGLAKITALLAALAGGLWFQWGTGSGAATSANTVTTTGTTEARVEATLTQAQTNVANDTLQATGTITASAAKTVTEVGLFDAAGSGSPPVGGNMDFYSDFSAVNLNSGDSIAFTLKVSFQ